MVQNIKRAKRSGERSATNLPIIPETYLLPGEQAMWLDSTRTKGSGYVWIVKPAGGSQGRGIFLVTRRSQLTRWMRRIAGGSRRWLISRYLDHPLLIDGRKFDMRIYVLVTSYQPLIAYIHNEGFCRFCTVPYSLPRKDDESNVAHLTNVSLQKYAAAYDQRHGGKWPISQLFFYLESLFGSECVSTLWQNMRNIILASLQSVAGVMGVDRHSFELYGYDLMLDDELVPWLIEVNASPSLVASTQADRVMKTRVFTDMLRLVIPPGWLGGTHLQKAKEAQQAAGLEPVDMYSYPRRNVPASQLGGFELLADESVKDSGSYHTPRQQQRQVWR